jgi:hypothetical protein
VILISPTDKSSLPRNYCTVADFLGFGITRERVAATGIAGWVRTSHDPVLIAIDAPLGWPKQLALTLINNRAAMAIETPPNAMFRRTTDVFIQQKLKKTRSMSARHKR